MIEERNGKGQLYAEAEREWGGIILMALMEAEGEGREDVFVFMATVIV